MSKHAVRGGDVSGLLERFAQLRKKARARTGKVFPFVVIQEAGLDGFSIDRVLRKEGMESPSSQRCSRSCASAPGRPPRWSCGSPARRSGSSSGCCALRGSSPIRSRSRAGAWRTRSCARPSRDCASRPARRAWIRGGSRRALALLEAALARHEHDFPLSDRAERLPGARRRLQADLERYVRHAAAQPSPLEPAHLELGFGFEEGSRGLPAWDLGGGLRLRGRIDRIDVGPGGEAVVYDYKSGHVSPGARWIEDGKVQLALYMRAAQELLGVRVIGGFYQPLAGADLRARGVLDTSAGVALDCVQTDRVEPAELDALIDRAIALAREAAAQAIAGEIRPRPETCGYPRGCAYPAICRCGR